MKQHKLLTALLGGVVLVVISCVGSLYGESKLIGQETSAIIQTITLMLSGYREHNAEQVYAQMVSIKQGGHTTLDQIRFAVTGPELEFEIYQSKQIEVMHISLWRHWLPFTHGRATARMTLTFENGCQVPYLVWLRQIDTDWKVYDVGYENMDVFEVRTCIRGD